jgi:hypothetical protein
MSISAYNLYSPDLAVPLQAYPLSLNAWLDQWTYVGGSTPSNAYVAEDGSTFYVAEDGTTYYVQEM